MPLRMLSAKGMRTQAPAHGRLIARGEGATKVVAAGAAATGDGFGGCICAASAENMSSLEWARPCGLGSGLGVLSFWLLL